VQDATILNVGVGADADGVDVAADYGVHPYRGVLAEDHVADDLGGFVYVAAGGDGWGDAFEGSDHSGSNKKQNK
jgi:hypothetical protein